MIRFDGFDISDKIYNLGDEVENAYSYRYKEIDEVSAINTAKVLYAFRKNFVSAPMFAPSTGYGYDDLGRDTLDLIYADVFKAEKALVRASFANGTHTITCALFSAVKPGDKLIYVTGEPYDTIHNAIGIEREEFGSLRFYGIGYDKVDLNPDGTPDLDGIAKAVAEPNVTAAVIQRSRGYAMRPAMTIDRIKDICDTIKKANPNVAILVDNCYGEFVETKEPIEVGADLVAGSLIKNPGAGLAPTGGYIAGRADLVDAAAMRLTTPGIGGECGSYIGGYRLMYQGLFTAPHTVAQALKTAVFAAGMMEALGYETLPKADDKRSDIVQSVNFGIGDDLEAFCRGIQASSPVDSFATPVPGDMPGYADQVIMAAGTFVQGSSIELSCDGPMRPPFTAYMQGGLTYESGRLSIMLAADYLTRK